MDGKMKKTLPRSPLPFIFFFLKPYFGYFLIFLIVPILWAIDTSLEPYFIKLVLDTLEKTPRESELLIHLSYPILFYAILRIFINLINRVHDYISLKFLPHFNNRIVIRLTKYLQRHSHSYFQHHFGGSLVSKISTIADTAESILNDLVNYFIFPFITFCFAALIMGTVHPLFASILVTWTLFFLLITYYLSYQVQSLSEQLSEKYTTLVGKLIDSVTNILAVRLFARQKYEINVLESTAQEKLEKAEELRWNNLKRSAVMEVMANALIGILIYALISERQKGTITIGDFSLVFTLSLSIIDIIWDISRNYIRFVESLGKCAQALNTILIPYEIKDSPDATLLLIGQGDIELKNISFNYSENKALFENLSLRINGNEKVGIVGYSGSGKTTLLNLIVRLFDLKSGAILIDGQDIKQVTQDSLHQNISFIPQDPLLFHRTIMENIRYGNLDASNEKVREAAKKACVDQFIESLPQGYQTLIGERGSMLSGGQRQRLAIARAILKDAKILILDEATSALDSETEYYIQQSLEALMENKTVLVVAHRLSTLLKMDRIIAFDQGKIIEEGNHQNLILKGGIYAKFWHMQISKNAA